MLVPRYLEVSIESLTREQEKFRNHMAQAFGVGGFGALEDQARRDLGVVERTFAMVAPFARRQGGQSGEEPPSGIGAAKPRLNEMQRRLDSLTAGGRSEQSSGEIDELKRQLGEMQRRLEQLTGAKEA